VGGGQADRQSGESLLLDGTQHGGQDFFLAAVLMIAVAVPLAVSKPSSAATAKEIAVESERALTRLYNEVPSAREYGRKAKGILVFREITKAGVGIGGSYGEGALFVGGKPVQRRLGLAGA
jgi:lipid-binding SYLF domain-containing protein